MRLAIVLGGILLALWCGSPAIAENTVSLLPGTPLFLQPAQDSRLLGVTNQTVPAEPSGEWRMSLVRQHPLARYYWFERMTLPDGKACYIQPETYVGTDSEGKPTLSYLTFDPQWRYLFLLFCVGALLFLGVEWVRKRRSGEVYSDAGQKIRLAAVLVLSRWLLLLVMVMGGGNIIANPVDDVGYFLNARSFLDWDFSTPWHYTVGQSILYLPFILATGARDVQEIMVPFSWFSGFLLAPGMLVAGYFIALKLAKSTWAAFFAMLAWALLPFFFHHNPNFDADLFETYWHLPFFGFSFPHYITLIGTGFNAMSDTPSTLAMLLVLAGILYLPGKFRWFGLLGVLFGFGCMLRINNIFFAPLFALAAWLKYGACWWRDRRRFGLSLIAGGVGFLVGFLPQMLANWYFYGNPLLFSYTRYSAGAHTYFAWIFFQENLPYYGSVNSLVWMAGGCGLLWMRDRALRTVLAWWAVPIIFFFAGYSHGTDDPVRFILTSFPALFIAATACGLWLKVNWRDWLWFAVPLVLVAQLRPNICMGDWMRYFALSWEVWRPFRVWYVELWVWVPIGALWWHFHRKLSAVAWYGAAMAVLYLYGNSYILALILLAAWLRAIWDTPGLLRAAVKYPGGNCDTVP